MKKKSYNLHKLPHVLLKVFWGIYIDNVFKKQCFADNVTGGQI